jgi:hypothetical protein
MAKMVLWAVKKPSLIASPHPVKKRGRACNGRPLCWITSPHPLKKQEEGTAKDTYHSFCNFKFTEK